MCLRQAPLLARGAVRASDLEDVTIRVEEAFGFSGSRELCSRELGSTQLWAGNTCRKSHGVTFGVTAICAGSSLACLSEPSP